MGLRQILRAACAFILISSVTASAFAETEKDPPHKEKCYTCHAEETPFTEWKLSRHAKALTYLRTYDNANDSCLSCHSSGAKFRASTWRSRNVKQVTLETAVNEVGCSSCHLHSSKREHYLIKSPLTLCIGCHQMDCGCSGKGIIHQSQSEMYLGRRGIGVPLQPSPHLGVVPKDCAGCHMHKVTSEEDQAEHGGHTFKATYDACLQCHGNAMPRVEQAKLRIGKLLKEVNALLEKHEDKESTDYKTIERHRDMVIKDGGYGMHNFTYAETLLRQALKVGEGTKE